MSKAALLAAAAALGALVTPVHAQAQDAAAATGPVQGVAIKGGLSYVPENFARFVPRSALDMVNRVPGFSIRDNDEARGLGEATSNILVNGERVANKAESVYDRMARIPADKVERIEIVDASNFAIPGLAGQVANIVTRPGGISGQFKWNAAVRPHFAPDNFYGGEVSLNGTAGKLEYTLALSNSNGRGGVGGPYSLSDGAGATTELRDMVLAVKNENPQVAATIKWDAPGSSVGNFHANYHRTYFDLLRTETRDLITGTDNDWRYDAHERGYDYEIGGDFEFALGPGRLKLIGLHNENHGHYYETAVSDYLDATPSDGSRYRSFTDTAETIARGEYGWKMLGGDWQLAVEAAYNGLDRVSHLLDLRPDGVFEEQPFPGSTGGVREDRYEAILTHTRQLAPNLSFQLGAGAEYSRLAETGPGGLVRTFYRPKGSATLSWTPKKGIDLSLKLARKVGQLSFDDFLADVDLGNNTENSSNALLKPNQNWEANFEAKKDFGRWGSSTLKLYGTWLKDAVTLVPLPGPNPGDPLVEGVGNVDRAQTYGVSLDSTVNLDPLGFKGAKIDFTGSLEKTRIRDPLTHVIRQFSYEEPVNLEVSLRHDIPKTAWAWGGGIEYHKALPYYRLDEVGYDHEGPIYTWAFIEHKNVFGMTAHLEVFNLTNGRGLVKRTIYDGPRDSSPILFVEHRNQLVGPIVQFSLKGTF
ncbi:MAG: TonB-dependent receptor [Candidatus Andeanibacterium colombiense]|uniref:TonB-dependent receptor n=1 Tax=Candidatus Andeanibacterium colombiense TaxID=3121345 RepID=A0AAJ5X433_9SPHN|nr:MAG: TonB-dependent receptor [Sphingomonadaceae bacterium]